MKKFPLSTAVIVEASKKTDLNAAMKIVQDAIGQTDGGICAEFWSDFDDAEKFWAEITESERIVYIGRYLAFEEQRGLSSRHTNQIAIDILDNAHIDYPHNEFRYDAEYKRLVEAMDKATKKQNDALVSLLEEYQGKLTKTEEFLKANPSNGSDAHVRREERLKSKRNECLVIIAKLKKIIPQ